MTAHLLVWCVLYVVLAAMTLRRPIWGIALFFLTIFANPAYWLWWGAPLAGVRVNLLAVLILAISMLIHDEFKFKFPTLSPAWKASRIVTLVLANALFVHVALAADWGTSWELFVKLLKFVIFFLIVLRLVRTRTDFMFFVTVLVVGLAFWGYEKALTSDFSGRLESLKAPDCSDSNTIAIWVAVLVPLAGSLIFLGRRWQRWLGAFAAAAGIELLNRFNSRGALLAFGIAGIVFVILCMRGQLRRYGAVATVLGVIAVVVLISRDPRVMGRFTTTFASPEARDESENIRLITWQVACRMIGENPLGAGGQAFKLSPLGVQYKKQHAAEYIRSLGYEDTLHRAAHNGYLQEATDWGIQGLVLKLWLLFSSGVAVLRVVRQERESDDPKWALIGVCLLSGVTALLVGSMFVDLMDNETIFWMAALCVTYAMASQYGQASTATEVPTSVGRDIEYRQPHKSNLGAI